MPPTIHCTLRGFKEQHYIDVQRLSERIKCLPDWHIENLKEIIYLPSGRYIYPVLNSPPSCKGEYDQGSKTVRIFPCCSLDELLHVLFHEIGHHVFYSALPLAERQRWARVCLSERSWVTSYARTNVAEDFAESYAIYTCKLDSFKLPARKHFISSLF